MNMKRARAGALSPMKTNKKEEAAVPYNKITPEIAARLRACVGEGRFYVKDEIDPNYSHDEMPIYGRHMPDAAVDVETAEEVSAIIREEV